MSQSSVSNSDASLNSNLQSQWRILLAAGIVVAVLGLVATLAPFVTGISIAVLVGSLLVAGGVFQLVGAFRGDGWRSNILQAVLGGVSLLAGAAVFLNPVFGLMTLTLLVIGYLLASGLVEVVMGVRLRGEKNWVWTVASGAIGIVLGLMLWAGFPSTALWAVGVLFGVNLLVTGASMVALALGAREFEERSETEAVPGAGGV